VSMPPRDRAIPLGSIVGALAIAVPAGLFLWFVGISIASTLAFAVTVIASGIAWGGYAGSTAPTAYRARPGPRPGVRSDAAQLSWALRDRDGQVSEPGEKRIRLYARRRLARHGLDLDDPLHRERIEALIGESAYALLNRSGGPRPPLSAIEHCLDALDALASARAHSAGPTPQEGRPTP
jgi:hypothetical protein